MNEDNKTFWQAMFTVLILAAFGVVCFIAGSETDSAIFVIIGIVLIGFAIWCFVNLINEQLQKKAKNNSGESAEGKEIGCSVFVWIIIIAIIIAFFTMCSGGEVDNSIAYDSDGFLGYSDSFWEWWGDQ